MSLRHYGVLIPALQPLTGVLHVRASDWEPLRSLVRDRLSGRLEISQNDHLRVLLFDAVFEVPAYLVRILSDHAAEEVAAIVTPELLRIANTHTRSF